MEYINFVEETKSKIKGKQKKIVDRVTGQKKWKDRNVTTFKSYRDKSLKRSES